MTFRLLILAALVALWPIAALAHAAEQAFVLLLPTGVYTASGVVAVAATVLLIAVAPPAAVGRMFRPVPLGRPGAGHGARMVTSMLAFVVFWALIAAGWWGTRDPLENPLPLTVWTLWWVAFVLTQGLLGDLWAWVNPWTGPAALARRLGARPLLRYPPALGHAPGLLVFFAFAAVLLADPAPADPARLAVYAGGYWLFAFAMLGLFGPRWLIRGEGLTMALRAYARLGIFGRLGGKRAAGLPGWRLLARPGGAGIGLMALVLLGAGSFDGVNETFRWFALLGVNPLEFPGRSAVIVPNLVGLAAGIAALTLVFATTCRAGLWLADSRMGTAAAIARFGPALLPIALGYHAAHYLPGFLVDVQYAALAINDPLHRGWNLLGLRDAYVTTGFFNTQATVRAIWLSQAGCVVGGHVLSVLLAHAIAVDAFGTTRRAALSQAPLAAFMIFYTFFGLWLLAAPRGA